MKSKIEISAPGTHSEAATHTSYKEDAKKALIDAIAQFKEYCRCLKLYESLKEASLAQDGNNGFRENSGDR